MIKIKRKKVASETTVAFQQAVEEKAQELSQESWERVAELEVQLEESRLDNKELEYRLLRMQQRLPKKKKQKKMTIRGEAPPPGAIVTLEEIPPTQDILLEQVISAQRRLDDVVSVENRGPELEVEIDYNEEVEAWEELDEEAYVERARPAPTRTRRRRRVRPNTE